MGIYRTVLYELYLAVRCSQAWDNTITCSGIIRERGSRFRAHARCTIYHVVRLDEPVRRIIVSTRERCWRIANSSTTSMIGS
jgi:hypothetical protein